MAKPRALLTNDDGISCRFLQVFAEALSETFDLCVVAPSDEKSWTGKAMSRIGQVAVKPYDGLLCPAWSVSGTPADCVNLALGNLLTGKPDIVISGINIGLNTTLPMILYSGTVAGALEGACWGLPAQASSIAVPNDLYQELKMNGGWMDVEKEESLLIAAEFSAKMAKDLLDSPPEDFAVHNVNFPLPVRPDTPVERTAPAPNRIGSLFQETGEGRFEFRFQHGPLRGTDAMLSDWNCLKTRRISYCVLRFANLGGE